jgi:RNA polymerase sigma factor (sigma-70 family)
MDSLRQVLTTYAYNILGSYEDAKDIVQDVMLEMINRTGAKIENEKAYLTRAVINRAINAKNRQKKLLSSYPGNWLPEPVATETADGEVHQKDILSYSLMVLLEKLDPKQRAVFILKEAFAYEHEEIADVLDISIENSRKILSRARKEISAVKDAPMPHSIAPPFRAEEENINGKSNTPTNYLDKYIEIIRSRDIKRLEQLLNDEIVIVSDGGGKAKAAMNQLIGKERASLFLHGIYNKFYDGRHIEKGQVNHHPALFYYDDGKLVNCQIFEFENGGIRRIYFMRNPDKLATLGESTRFAR